MTIGERVRAARKGAKLSQEKLAEKIGIAQPTLSELERGISSTTAFIAQIAEACGVNSYWLATGKGDMHSLGGGLTEEQLEKSNIAPPPVMGMTIPLISWVQAGAWTEVCDVDLSGSKMLSIPGGYSSSTFALRVKGQSMAPRYEPDLLIIVDPEVVPHDGDDVVAMLTDDNEATFKQYVEEPGGHKFLKARNPNWPDPWIEINGNCEIIGVVVATLWQRTPRTR